MRQDTTLSYYVCCCSGQSLYRLVYRNADRSEYSYQWYVSALYCHPSQYSLTYLKTSGGGEGKVAYIGELHRHKHGQAPTNAVIRHRRNLPTRTVSGINRASVHHYLTSYSIRDIAERFGGTFTTSYTTSLNMILMLRS